MEHEGIIRLCAFLGILFTLILAESWFERKPRVQSRRGRWTTNFAITITNTIVLNAMAFVMPVMVVSATFLAQSKGWGILNYVEINPWIAGGLTILFFDFVIWAQHLLTHKIPILWRLHRVHHSDRDIDVTSAIRFHPLEIAFSIFIKIIAVFILGPAALAVIIYEILLNAMAMFNHANLRLPLWVDKILRQFIVTPDMHRVHHSITRQEHDRNYGNFLSIWDRMFGTYKAEPDLGHTDMILGLQWQDDRTAKIGWALWLPFLKK